MWSRGQRGDARQEGKLNDELIDIVRANVRVPDEVIGDLAGKFVCGAHDSS